MKRVTHYKNSAFTVFEISIVVTVIGLIIGGLMIGADLLHVARVQKTLVHVDSINKAVKVFEDRYHAFPGDMPNAETFWGADASCPNTPWTDEPHKETCNGNGNSHIGDMLTDGTTTRHELFRAWQQLANAELYEGFFTGLRGDSNALSFRGVPGLNVPESSLEGGGYSLAYLHVPTTISGIWAGDYQHVVIFGSENQDLLTAGRIITPKEAFAIDEKIDDARPAYGKLRTFRSSVLPNCTTSDTANSSSYNTAYLQKACSLIFIMGF